MQEIAAKIETIAKQRFAGQDVIIGSASHKSVDGQTYYRVFINQLGLLRRKTVISAVASFEIWPRETTVKYYIRELEHTQTIAYIATLAAQETNLQFLNLSST